MGLVEKIKTAFSGVRGGRRREIPLTGARGSFSRDGTGHLDERRAVELQSAVPDPVQGQTWRVGLGDGAVMEFAPVRAGRYNRGSKRWFAGEKPVHCVVITHSFWMARYHLTQGVFEKLEGYNPSYFEGEDRPVEMVTWYEAMRFCRKLSRMEDEDGNLPQGYEYRLPTEGEWEYAARGGSSGEGYRYSGSNDIDLVAWHGGGMGDRRFSTMPVGLKAPNKLGLYDMSGNVWEWCYDWHRDYPKVRGMVDPAGPDVGSHRLLRGGSCGYDAGCCRVTRRDGLTPGQRYCDVGFRVALAPSLELLRKWSRRMGPGSTQRS